MKPSSPVFLGQKRLEVDRLCPNPLNPRPEFHLDENDPKLLEMADSIRTDGLHNPIKVYEIADKPGFYRIVQGHRRTKAARLGKVVELDSIILQAPANRLAELAMLGSEDAHKLPWGLLYQLQYAQDLKSELELDSLSHPEIIAKTGLTRKQLAAAEKVFKLDESIVALVKEYETLKYETFCSGERQIGRLGKQLGLNTLEFSVEKAAIVWDIYESLLKYYPTVIKGWEPKRAQFALAQAMSATNIDDGLSFLTQVRSTGANPRSGVIVRLHEILESPRSSGNIRSFLRSTGGSHVANLIKTMQQVDRLESRVVTMTKKIDQISDDPDLLRQANISLLRIIRSLDKMQQKVDIVMRAAEKRYNG